MEGKLIHDIVEAMEKHELQAYYQPQYNAKKGVIGGAEALVRWVKEDGTVVSPAEFIPVLEEKGQVSIVDWFIVEETCKTIKELGDKAVRISVNFSREHAKDPDFTKKLDKLVEYYQIDKSLLGIEITESDVVTNKKSVIDWINEIEKAGYIVSIDDFGSGMSSLSFVKDIPAQFLKIDKSFLNDNCQSEKGRIALESVFYFAHRLRMTTVVEGVETQEQLQFINTCDCDYIQGFLFSKPISKEEFLLKCIKEVPVDMGIDQSFENAAMFSQVKLLVESVYKKFPLIIIANLTKNSFQVLRKENFIDAKIPQTGSYDKGYQTVRHLSFEEDLEELDKAFLRENLLAAYERGEKKIVKIFYQKDRKGNVHRVAVEDYFMLNEATDDVYIVAFFQILDFDDGVYLNSISYEDQF